MTAQTDRFNKDAAAQAKNKAELLQLNQGIRQLEKFQQDSRVVLQKLNAISPTMVTEEAEGYINRARNTINRDIQMWQREIDDMMKRKSKFGL